MSTHHRVYIKRTVEALRLLWVPIIASPINDEQRRRFSVSIDKSSVGVAYRRVKEISSGALGEHSGVLSHPGM